MESSCKVERDAYLGKLQPIVTAANIANDECDFGTSLELGLDLFCFGGEVFHCTALNLLRTAYSLLQRNEFAVIAEVCINLGQNVAENVQNKTKIIAVV